MLADLHTHSLASDGVLAPAELLARAENNGVNLLALTDHDTMSGVQAVQASIASGELQTTVELVPGVEITTMVNGACVQVVGLWLDSAHSGLQRLLNGQRQVRVERAERIAVKLEREGMQGVLEGARRHAGEAVISRPHFARYLVEQQYCTNEQQAFRRWLGKSKVGDVACIWPELEEVVATVQSAGGVAVLAHPTKYGLTRTKLDGLIGSFSEARGDAIELVSGAQQSNVTNDLLKLCERYPVAFSTGSDFHSPAQTWCDLGQQPAMPETAEPIWTLRQAAA